MTGILGKETLLTSSSFALNILNMQKIIFSATWENARMHDLVMGYDSIK